MKTEAVEVNATVWVLASSYYGKSNNLSINQYGEKMDLTHLNKRAFSSMLYLPFPNALCATSVERGIGPALQQKMTSLDVVGAPAGVPYGVEGTFLGVYEAKDLEQQQRTVIVKSGQNHWKQKKGTAQLN